MAGWGLFVEQTMNPLYLGYSTIFLLTLAMIFGVIAIRRAMRDKKSEQEKVVTIWKQKRFDCREFQIHLTPPFGYIIRDGTGKLLGEVTIQEIYPPGK